MANGLLKKIALAGMVGASALFGTSEASATPVEWNSFGQIVGSAQEGSAVYLANTIDFMNGQNGPTMSNNPQFSLIYFATFPEYGGVSMAVGGLDGSNTTAQGYFNVNVPWVLPGLNVGQTANQTEGNVDNGYWVAFIDLNGDGKYGTYDVDGGLFYPQANEYINDIHVANFQGFQAGAGALSAGDISGWYTVPEPSTFTLLGVGASALALPNGTNVIHFRIAVTNLASFRVEYRDNLTNTVWTSLGTFSATGAVTEVSDTNTAPARFYRAVSP